MDPFRTSIKIKPGLPINHKTGVFTIGSCFAQLLGEKLKEARFPCVINPFGVSYNAIAIHNILQMALQRIKPDAAAFVESEGSVRHLDFHSAFRSRSVDDLRAILIDRLLETSPFVRNSKVIIVTYGTSWVYRHLQSGKIVNNCHKLPSREFEKFFVEPQEMVGSFGKVHALFNETNPGVRFILTVSPVRHLRDSLDLNQLSKSGLILACHQIVKQFPGTEYFPAYEIMMDDLRDYRFYDTDMIHPSPTAVEYIWEKFGERFFTKETMELADRCRQLDRALSHRPFDPASADHKAFLRSTLRLAKELHQMDADVESDIVKIEERLKVG